MRNKTKLMTREKEGMGSTDKYSAGCLMIIAAEIICGNLGVDQYKHLTMGWLSICFHYCKIKIRNDPL